MEKIRFTTSVLLLAFGISGSASAQQASLLASQALELMSASVKCPLPNETFEIHQPWHQSSLESKTNSFEGNLKSFEIVKRVRTSIRTEEGVDVFKTTVEINSANWAAIDEIISGKIHKFATLRCRDHLQCISTTSKVTQGFQAGSSQSDKNSDLEIDACDGQAAENIETAASILIRLSGGQVGQFYKVVANPSVGILNMRAGPGADTSIVVAVPDGAADVLVGGCQASSDNAPVWCRSEWHGYKGWMSGCCMISIKSGELARKKAFFLD
jgi:hypothetical protein